MFKLILFLFVLAFPLLTRAADKIKLTLNWKPEPEFGGFYAAQASGAYKEAGLDVQINPGGSGTPVVQMIASGQTAFGVVSADELIIARSRGTDVVALFAVFQTSPLAIMTHAELGFDKLADVFNHPGLLALERGLPFAEFLLKRFPNPKVKVVPYSGGIGNFLSNRDFSQQCFVTSEVLAAKKRGAPVKAFMIADEGYNPYVSILATSGETLKKNPDMVGKLVAATRKGWAEYQRTPMRANQLMGSLNKALDEKTFSEIATEQRPLIEPAGGHDKLGAMTEGRWRQLTDQLLNLKIIDKAPDTKAMFVNM